VELLVFMVCGLKGEGYGLKGDGCGLKGEFFLLLLWVLYDHIQCFMTFRITT